MRRRLSLSVQSAAAAIAITHAVTLAGQSTLPTRDGSVKFAVIGDSGTGGSSQRRIAERLAASRAAFPFEFALMLGDNLYGDEDGEDFVEKFERPYKALLGAGVKFYATLGNHDDPAQVFYKPFNMKGEQFYSFKPERGSVRFFSLNSNYMDKPQLAWLEKALAASDSDWKIAFFHHPLYSSGDRHGSDEVLRAQLEPLFVKFGVDLVLTGHEHFYERIKPQQGIHYIIAGSAAKLRRGNIERSNLTAKGFDQGYAFLLMEIVGDVLHFEAITDTGKTVDWGTITRRGAARSSGAAPSR